MKSRKRRQHYLTRKNVQDVSLPEKGTRPNMMKPHNQFKKKKDADTCIWLRLESVWEESDQTVVTLKNEGGVHMYMCMCVCWGRFLFSDKNVLIKTKKKKRPGVPCIAHQKGTLLYLPQCCLWSSPTCYSFLWSVLSRWPFLFPLTLHRAHF